MAPAFSKMDVERFTAAYSRNRPTIQRLLRLAFAAWTLGSTYYGLTARRGDSGQARANNRRKKDGGKGNEAAKPHRVRIDAVIYQRLRVILRIVIPGIRSKEAMLLIMHSSLLVFRTAISIYVANLDGRCVGFAVCGTETRVTR
jgi:ATP-binding cassette subfamily D (ALD) long-chain fatty acid import protein